MARKSVLLTLAFSVGLLAKGHMPFSTAGVCNHNTSWNEYRQFSPVVADQPEPNSVVDSESFVLPLKRAGNLVLLEAIVDGINGNLILDSGSSAMVLNSIYFRGGHSPANLHAGGITGTTGTLTTTRINSLQISNLHFNRLEAGTVDLGYIENARNIKVLGFFGLGLFRDYEIVIDLVNNSLELHKLNVRGSRVARNNVQPKFDLQISAIVKSNVVFFEGVINRTRLTFCLDTGAECNVIANNLPNHILSTIGITRRSSLRGASGDNLEVLYGVMNHLEIGQTDIGGMQVMITNLNTMSHYYGLRIDGMLGCEFLEKGIFYINLKQEKLGIVFNKQ